MEKSFDVFGTYDKSNTFVIFNTFDKIVWSNIDSIPAPVWNMGGLNWNQEKSKLNYFCKSSLNL